MATHQSATMIAWVYQIVLSLALPLVWLRLQLRARREPACGERQGERFGVVPAGIRAHGVWFHTVSAGETIAAAPLIRALAGHFSASPFLVTTMTPTGSAQVSQRLADCVDHCYAPYDFGFAVRRFFDRVQPRVLILMETELWPNLIAEAHRRGVPVLLVNARLSERSTRGYQRIGSLTRPMMQRMHFIACQSADHVDRFISLGADESKVAALGSVKYDVTLPPDFSDQVQSLSEQFEIGGRPVWIAASTHPGEDEIVLRAFAEIRVRCPELVLLLVPRHPVRTDAVSDLVTTAGFSVSRHSTRSQGEIPGPTDVVIGDVMGTLLTLYGLADIAFVGGSFVAVGGHNPLEPALCRIPIVSGPHQFNFTDVMKDLENCGGLQTVQTSSQLATTVIGWLADDPARQRAGEAAAATLDENRGATAKVTTLLRKVITDSL
jgi:3-deoxy-D-manno-octulosonic-acid transferase